MNIYKLHKTNKNFGIKCEDAQILIPRYVKEEHLLELVDFLNRNDAAPVHLKDVVDDFLCDYYVKTLLRQK